ncbi:hypothetical protein [Rhodonellum sp.]|uniref:hypothetical protein n=1 Tax=Rhodonellum sp. TaxID=2231180 RepID=UPI002725BE8E|nr:hypothetical protein [Rhodonellum sp.]MDO9552223.1 hypothetical protein [Rhodonellum sp.]
MKKPAHLFSIAEIVLGFLWMYARALNKGYQKEKAEIKDSDQGVLQLKAKLKILSHGKEGAANGIIKSENGKNYPFTDIYKVQSAKVKTMPPLLY